MLDSWRSSLRRLDAQSSRAPQVSSAGYWDFRHQCIVFHGYKWGASLGHVDRRRTRTQHHMTQINDSLWYDRTFIFSDRRQQVWWLSADLSWPHSMWSVRSCGPFPLCSNCLFDLQVAQSQNKVYLSADSLVLNLQDRDSFKWVSWAPV